MPDAPASCAGCGASTDEPPPVTWSWQATDRGTRWLCERCTRDRVRSIEARLGEDWE